MVLSPHPSIVAHFAQVSDPRTGNAKLHALSDILIMALCAVICGADDWEAISRWGKTKRRWLKRFLDLPHGIPSPDTFRRVFERLNPEEFQKAFLEWVQSVNVLTQGQVIAIDGKTLRRSHDHALGKEAIHMVSAWATANHLVLGQVKMDEHSNEITAVPALLRLLEVSGYLVTVDAQNCQTEIAETIIAQGADYVLAVKENQKALYEELKDLFSESEKIQFLQVPHQHDRQVNKDHGRLEIRECWTLSDPDYLDYLRRQAEWKSLQTLICVRAERRIGRRRSVETRYYISSLANNAPKLLQCIRAHWGIENGLHWVLDIAFREDESRVRKDHGPENMAVLRHIALNLLKHERTAQVGIKNKRLQAAWDNDYLLKVLNP
jgi:predicted transposase YbfD/YdcC